MSSTTGSLDHSAEAFNAKYLGPEEVAKSFVYSDYFRELAGPYHAMLVGPRGSGKTTLLKMLQPAALAVWSGEEADGFRRSIKYSGVFIASDISWSKQLSAIGYGKLKEEHHSLLVRACFTTHVLQAVIDAMIGRLSSKHSYRQARLEPALEAVLAQQVAFTLQVSPGIASLASVRQGLRNRLTAIRGEGNRGALLSETEFASRLAGIDYLHLDLLDLCSNITTLFNEAIGEPEARWALLFDELETAPDWIVSQLVSAFRTADPKLYLKLAISPMSASTYRAMLAPVAPSMGHDHRQIRLWFSDKIESRGFCNELWNSLTRNHGLEISATEALGRSFFEPSDNKTTKTKSPYSPGAHWHKVFTELAAKDRSFAAFLRAQHIDFSAPPSTWMGRRDSVLRKAAPVAAVRHFFLHQSKTTGEVRPKQRKTSRLFAGADAIFAITEGNPRWFISIVSPMIKQLVESGKRKVPEEYQARLVDASAERLIALLKTIPVAQSPLEKNAVGLDKTLETIGTHLHDELVDKNFTMDPKLHFIVDRDVPNYVVALLASAVNRGAAMIVDDDPSRAIIGDMRGAKLRLSYLLAAKYGLPLRRGKHTNLSNLLFPKRAHEGTLQLELEEEDEA